MLKVFSQTNLHGKKYICEITTFRRKKWEKYILLNRKMNVKYFFANIFRTYKEDIF